MAKKSTALVKWDDELAKQAEAYARQEASTGGGQFFSTRGGTLKLNDAPIENDEMAVVVLDSVLENVYYDEDFDPDNRTSPSCYALGRDETALAPHDQSEKPQAASCEECEFSKFGSANKGRGKACKNRRRLALIPAGTINKAGEFEAFDEEDAFTKSQVAYLNIPPTSINSFGAYVKQVANVLRRPLHAVFTKVSLVSDDKTQFKFVFETLGKVPDELVGALIERNKAQQPETSFPYQKTESAPKTKKAAGRRESKPVPKRNARF